MAKTSLGKVSVLPKGEYSSVIQYSRLDIVTYKGSSYICIKDSLGIEITNEEYWQLLAQKGDTGETGATGAKGDKGDAGKDFSIYKTYPSISAMESDASNVPDGEFVLIASDVEDTDNAKLYVKSNTGFVYLTDLSGATGIKGEKGDKPINGIDYNTPEEKEEFKNEVVENATVEVEQNIANIQEQAIQEFNSNASTKTNEYNSNTTTKLQEYNTNANTKIEEYNSNATQKTNTFNGNATTQIETFNNNATSKTNDFNSNASTKTDEFNTNYEEKLESINEASTSIEQERVISDGKYARALKTPVTDVESTQIYAENDVVDDLIINGVELKQVVTENSPSLDNPSEIQIASEQNIQICKNNYLNTTQIANENFSNGGLTVATDENGIFTVNGTHSEQVNINFTNLNFNIKENQVIKLIPLDGNVNYQGNILNCINLILCNKEWKTLALLNLNSSLITSSDTVKYFQVRFIIPVQQSSITYTNFKFGIMVINADDNIQDYHTYYGTNITIPLINSAIGQHADTIDRENNVQNKVIQELTLTGDENWNAAGSNDATNVFSISLNYSVENYTGLCNFLKTGVSGNAEKFTPLGTSLYISVNKTRASTVEEFKALLAQLYSSGNPLKVYLVRVSPTKNPLSEEAQTALSNLKLYQDLNNVAIDGGSMSFIYNKSLPKTIEEMQDEIKSKDNLIQNLTKRVEALEKAQIDNVTEDLGGN